MKKIILNCFLFSCFFCSWAVSADHEEKSQVGDRAARLQPEEEGRAVSSGAKNVPAGGVLDDDAVSVKGRRARLKSLSMADSQAPLTFEKDEDAEVLVVHGSRLDAGKGSFGQQLEDVRVLRMERTGIRDDVVPITDAIKRAKGLERIEIVGSNTSDTFLFFLGIAIEMNPAIRTLFLDGNHVRGVGLKGFLLGLYRMKNLQRFSWRNMNVYGWQLPFDKQYVRVKAGYDSFENANIETNVLGVKRTHHIKFYDKPVLRWIVEDFLGAHPNLKTFDITGSFSYPTDEAHERIVSKIRGAKDHEQLYGILASLPSGFRHMDAFDDEDTDDVPLPRLKAGVIDSLAQAFKKDREHVFAILDGVATLKNLQVLGLGHIFFDEFAIRRLARVIGDLRQQQSLQGKTVSGDDLKVLYLPGITKGSQNLGALLTVFSGLVTLEEVDLSHNKMGGKGLHFFSELLKEVRALRILNAAGNELFAGSGGATRGIEMLKDGISSRKDTLEVLNLGGNNMRHTDLKHLEDALKVCRSLRVLDLRNNQLTEKSFDLLKGLLKGLPQIEQILLSGNSVSKAAYEQRLTDSQKEKILID